MTDASRWKATVYVGGLAPVVTTNHVYDAFLPFGEIADVTLPKPDKPNSTEPHRGFAYVEFEDAEDAKEAIDNMDQAELFGRVLKVSAAKPPKNADEGLGSKTALWEQVPFPRPLLPFFDYKFLTVRNRKAGWRSMPSMTRTNSRRSRQRLVLESRLTIPCKGWRASTLLGRDLSDGKQKVLQSVCSAWQWRFGPAARLTSLGKSLTSPAS
jgi:RNA recognition motif-containing protein